MNKFRHAIRSGVSQGILRRVDLWMSDLPPALQRLLRRQDCHIVVRMTNSGWTVMFAGSRDHKYFAVHWREATGTWDDNKAFERVSMRAAELCVQLELPHDLILTQSVELPEAALTNLSDAVTFGISAWSPFEAHELYLMETVADIRDGRVTVRLDYTRKSEVDGLLAQLKSIGLVPDRLSFPSRRVRPIELPSLKLRRLRRAQCVDSCLVATSIGLILLLCFHFFSELSNRLEQTEEAVRVELQELRLENSLKKEYEIWEQQRLLVSRRRATEVSITELMSALSRLLPPDAAVTSIEIEGHRGRVHIAGDEAQELRRVIQTIPYISTTAIEASRYPGGVTISFETIAKGL